MCGIFKYTTESKVWQGIHQYGMISSRVILLYLGCTLEYLALLQYNGAEQISAILSVGSSYLNIVVKDLVFTLKRSNLEEL